MIPTARLGSFEVRRFKGVLPRIALVFLIGIPLLYGALYLWSNWDPYGRLDQVPVAVVNHDQPVQVQGKTVDAGQQFVDELKNDRIFDWTFTNAADAKDGLANGRYYLTITVPKDFSANLASGAGPDPQRAVILLHRDDVNGYVIGMLTDSVQSKLKNAVDEAAIGTYFQAVFANLDEIRGGMNSAADGAGQLASGLDDAKDGSAQLVSELSNAKSGADKLADGAATAKKGAGTLADGLDQLQDGSATLAGGVDQLTTGATDLVDGANQVAAGDKAIADAVNPVIDTVLPVIPAVADAGTKVTGDVADLAKKVAGGTDSLATRTASAAAAYAAFAAAHPDVADDPAFKKLGAALDDVNARQKDIADATGTVASDAAGIHDAVADLGNSTAITNKLTDAQAKLNKLSAGAQQVAAGAKKIHTKLGDAATGAHQLADGISDADDGAHRLVNGLTDLSSGAAQLDGGLGKLAGGATDLDDGIDKLHSGAHELHDKVASGAARLPVFTPDQQQEAAQVLSSPADVNVTVDHPAKVYGRGLAPFFFAIAIWVFGISVFLVMRPISGRALAGRARASRLAMAGWVPVAGMAALGSLILLAVSWFALGLDPVHVGASIGVVVLAAACFSAIAHVLRTWLGTVGSAITLVLLMVQLTACGGLYPIETLPAPLRAIHPYIPMSYLVDGLRITFTGGPSGHLWRDVAVLAGFTIVALLAGIGVVAKRKRFTMMDLYPALD